MNSRMSYENEFLTITRRFDAPIEEVFDSWIETSKVQLWWGCGDAESVESEIDARVGGKYLHKLMLKDTGEYRHNGIITEYEPPKLLAYRLHDRFHDNAMTVRVEFRQDDTATIVCLTQDNLPKIYSQFVLAGWADGLEKLNTFLNIAMLGKGESKLPISP